MIGSGYLFSAQLTANYAGNWSFLAWVLTAIVIISTGLCYAKVVTKYPVRGATTRISSISHNSIFAVPFSFSNWLGIVVFVTSESLATTQYLSGVNSMQWIMNDNKITYLGLVLSAFILIIYFLINSYGVKLLIRINNGVTLFKITVPIIIIILFLYAGFSSSNPSNFAQNELLKDHFKFQDIFVAIVAGGLIYTFNGFQTIASYASEIENPKKNISISIIISVLIVLFIYIGLQYAFMQALPNEYLLKKGGWKGISFESPLIQLATILSLNYMVILLLINSIISPSGAGFVYLGSSSRMLYGLSEENQAPKYFSKINPNFNISRRSLFANLLLTLFFLLFSNNWAEIMLIVTGFNVIGYMAAPISMGAIFPKSRIFGCIVFIVLSLILSTLNFKTYILILIILVFISSIFFVKIYKKLGNVRALMYSLPFPTFMILVGLSHNIYVQILVSLMFYILVTSKKYIYLCHLFKDN